MEYDNMKILELREVARSRGLKGWTALRKNDLREFLIINGVRKPSTSKPKQVPWALNTDALLERTRELEEESRRLRQQQQSQPFPHH